MAQLALNYHLQDPNVQTYDEAVELLYASAARQKRNYIKHFVRLLVAADGALKFIDAIPRATGLSVVKKLDEHPGGAKLLREMLAEEEGRTAEDEQAVLSAFLARVVRTAKGKVRRPPARQAKTTFRLNRPEGEAKCTVADGRVELKLERDFSGVERKRLEAAVDAFLTALDEG